MGLFSSPDYETMLRRFSEGPLASANAQNERRYQQILDLWDDIRKMYRGQGKQAKQRARKGYRRDVANINQDAVSRGLYGSTIKDTRRLGARSRLEDNLLGIDEQVSRLRASALMGKAGAIERRTDNTALMQMMMQNLPAGGANPWIGMLGMLGGSVLGNLPWGSWFGGGTDLDSGPSSIGFPVNTGGGGRPETGG